MQYGWQFEIAVMMPPCRPHDVATGCRFEAGAQELADWLQTPGLQATIAPYTQAPPLGIVHPEALLRDDAAVEVRCADAFAAVRRFEELHHVPSNVSCVLEAVDTASCACRLARLLLLDA